MLRWLYRFLYPDRPRKNRRRNGQAGLEITVDPETGVCDICGERIHGGIE